MSDTPRTDDQSVRYYDDATGTRIEYVASRFARQLERELAAANQIMGELCESCGWAMRLPDQPCRCELERELAEVRKQRDTLMEAMIAMWPFIEEDDSPACNTAAFNAAIQKYKAALAAVKGGSNE
jgi:hypothetical protein